MRAIEAKIETIAGECLAMRVRRLNRDITRIYDGALRALGLKASQMNILVAVAKMELASPLKVCRFLHLDPSTLSRNVERMCDKGWLEVVPGDDARAQPLRMTDAGRKMLERAFPCWKKAQEQAKQLLGDGAVDLLGKTRERAPRSPR